jgi:hypothetical protein
MGFIHSKTRNRLDQQRSDMLQFLYTNLRAIRTAEHGKRKQSRKRKRIEEMGITTEGTRAVEDAEEEMEVEDEEDAAALEMLAAEAVRAVSTAASDAIWRRLQV